MENDPMSQAQRDAISKAWEILTEHFEKVLLVAEWVTETDGKEEDAHEGYWHGGALTAVGMAEFAKARIMDSGRRYNEPEM